MGSDISGGILAAVIKQPFITPPNKGQRKMQQQCRNQAFSCGDEGGIQTGDDFCQAACQDIDGCVARLVVWRAGGRASRGVEAF